MQKRTKNLLGIITLSVLLLTILIYELFPHVEFYFRMKRMLYKPDYIELYIYETEERIKITNQEDHLKIWDNIDLWFRKEAEPFYRDEAIAYLGFPVDIEGEIIEWPLYIYRDGVVLWGIPPRRDRYFNMPELRDETLRLIEKYSNKNQDRSEIKESLN